METSNDNVRAQSVSQLKTPEDLSRKLDSLRRGRQPLANQWKLNLAFYKGKQYSYFNRFAPNGGSVMSLPTEEGEKPRYRVRLISNQVITGVHSLLAKYTKTKPRISARPGSGSVADFKAAQMAESLFQFWWDEFSLDEKLEEALLWAIITGQGYWKIDWDPHANKQMSFMLDPQGNPILDDSTKTAFRAELEKYGIEPQEKTVYMGDIRVRAKSPFEVYWDNTASSWEDAKYVICEDYLDPDEVWARWKRRVEPNAASHSPDVALPFQGANDPTELNVVRVMTGYFKPGPSLPKGRYVVWVEKDDKPLYDGPWHLPTPDLPIIKFPGLRSPGQVYDGSHVEQAIPVQKELNRLLSQIIEYKNLTIRPRVWAPTNSVRTRLTSEPGALYEYNPVGNFKPEIEQMPSLPPYVFELLKEVAARLKDVFNLTEVSEGSVPPNVEAGIAIDLLQELSSDRIAPTIKLIEKCLEKAGQQMLTLAQTNYAEPRMMSIRGSGGGVQVRKFTQADIKGGVAIRVDTGSGMPRTRAGRQAQIERWVESGLLPADKAWKYVDLADLEGLGRQFQQNEEMAQREIEKIIRGETINPEAVQEVMFVVNQGINPKTGDPIQGPEEAQALLQEASLQPTVSENYDVHLDVLGDWMNSIEFDAMAPDVRQRAITHFNLTLQAKQALPQQQEPGKVNINYQVKGTMGPTGSSRLMERAGVNLTPEEAAEPPLETWVSDSVDKPDTDAAGPGQEAEHLSNAAATVLESNAKIAEAQLKSGITQREAEQSEAEKAQTMRHREEEHQARLVEARERVLLAKKKTAQSDFKPKPAAPAKGK